MNEDNINDTSNDSFNFSEFGNNKIKRLCVLNILIIRNFVLIKFIFIVLKIKNLLNSFSKKVLFAKKT